MVCSTILKLRTSNHSNNRFIVSSSQLNQRCCRKPFNARPSMMRLEESCRRRSKKPKSDSNSSGDVQRRYAKPVRYSAPYPIRKKYTAAHESDEDGFRC